MTSCSKWLCTNHRYLVTRPEAKLKLACCGAIGPSLLQRIASVQERLAKDPRKTVNDALSRMPEKQRREVMKTVFGMDGDHIAAGTPGWEDPCVGTPPVKKKPRTDPATRVSF